MTLLAPAAEAPRYPVGRRVAARFTWLDAGAEAEAGESAALGAAPAVGSA